MAKKNKIPAKKYLWEAKPPLTRSDVFADGWEIGDFFADNDEKAIERIERILEKHDIGNPQIIQLSCGGKSVRIFKRN